MRLPEWFRIRMRRGKQFARIESLLKDLSLNTVCKEGGCPNRWECWNRGTATFMILGNVCTRSCSFCGVTKGVPKGVDRDEAIRIAEAVKALGLTYVVITSVTRDDLKDGGAEAFALTVESIKKASPGSRVEVLIPDFKGSREALLTLLEASPDVVGHNMETVRRLYPLVRPGADYERSLEVLRMVRSAGRGILTKSGLILGFGERVGEIMEAMEEIYRTGCAMLTLGQYLMPSRRHLPVMRFYTPEEFEGLSRYGRAIGFHHVEAGPLVRSSYRAERYGCPPGGGCV